MEISDSDVFASEITPSETEALAGECFVICYVSSYSSSSSSSLKLWDLYRESNPADFHSDYALQIKTEEEIRRWSGGWRRWGNLVYKNLIEKIQKKEKETNEDCGPCESHGNWYVNMSVKI